MQQLPRVVAQVQRAVQPQERLVPGEGEERHSRQAVELVSDGVAAARSSSDVLAHRVHFPSSLPVPPEAEGIVVVRPVATVGEEGQIQIEQVVEDGPEGVDRRD